MASGRLTSDWPTRQVELTVAGVNLQLRVPDNPYALLDLPAVEDAFSQDEYMPYWAHLWPASMMLADWLIGQVREAMGTRDPAIAAAPMPPARVLEIGCGLAVPGLLAARLGYRVTLSDYDPDAVEYAQQNAGRNRVKVSSAIVDWRRPPVDRYQLILGADVLYEQRNHLPILELLRLSLAPAVKAEPAARAEPAVATGAVGAPVAALADPCRLVSDSFVRDARAAGWHLETISARWENTEGRIFLLRRCDSNTPPAHS